MIYAAKEWLNQPSLEESIGGYHGFNQTQHVFLFLSRERGIFPR